MSKLQVKLLALKREHPALQKIKFINIYLFLRVIFALLDTHPDPGTRLNPGLIRIRIQIHNSGPKFQIT